MDKVAALPPAEREELFRDAAEVIPLSPGLIEKDFWVCWLLEKPVPS